MIEKFSILDYYGAFIAMIIDIASPKCGVNQAVIDVSLFYVKLKSLKGAN